MDGTKLSGLALQDKADEIRKKIMDFHRETHRSHMCSSLSCVEILTALYYGIKRKEDFILLSKGHASSALYVILNDLGIVPKEVMNDLAAHPDFNPKYQIWATTGSLGHGLSVGAGIAYSLPNVNVYVVLGDGECDEGQVWEALRLSSELNLKNLTAVVDCNGFQGFKNTNYSLLAKKFSSFGWKTAFSDGHDCNALVNSINTEKDCPLVVFAKTTKGKGVSEVEGTMECHYFSFPKT